MMRRIIRGFLQAGLLVGLLVVLLFACDGWASAESAAPPLRGEGAAAISGYQVSGLGFKLGADPEELAQVEFDLDGEASQVLVGFGSVRERSYSCQWISGHHWRCPLEGVDLEQVDRLRISAVDG